MAQAQCAILCHSDGGMVVWMGCWLAPPQCGFMLHFYMLPKLSQHVFSLLECCGTVRPRPPQVQVRVQVSVSVLCQSQLFVTWSQHVVVLTGCKSQWGGPGSNTGKCRQGLCDHQQPGRGACRGRGRDGVGWMYWLAGWQVPDVGGFVEVVASSTQWLECQTLCGVLMVLCLCTHERVSGHPEAGDMLVV